MRLARFALRLHPCTPRTRGVSRRQGRMIVGGDFIALSALFLLLIPPARKSAGHIRNRRSAVAQRGSRGLLYSRAKFRQDDATGAAPPGRAVSVVFLPRHHFARKQNALHNASFRRGIRRGVGMCRSLPLCCIVSCRPPMTLGHFPRFPHPSGYTH